MIQIKHEITGKILKEVDCLQNANLQNADLRYADLQYANLQYANLHNADLRYANLHNADLRYADLRYADLRYANLQYADLRYADLQNANLQNANLRDADLRYADLQNANLQNADLRHADLQYADLQYAYLRDANLPKFQICPEEGSFIAFKKCYNGQIIKLLIPEDAKRNSCLRGRKCRASKAIVLSGSGKSFHDPSFEYKEGLEIIPDSYDDDIRVECSHGIHFFITRKEAEEFTY